MFRNTCDKAYSYAGIFFRYSSWRGIFRKNWNEQKYFKDEWWWSLITVGYCNKSKLFSCHPTFPIKVSLYKSMFCSVLFLLTSPDVHLPIACLFNPYVVYLPTRVVVNKTTLQKLNKCSRWATNSSCHRIDSHYSCIIFRENPANPKSFSQCIKFHSEQILSDSISAIACNGSSLIASH